jgi:NADH-quinone oxidoreductase subunit M
MVLLGAWSVYPVQAVLAVMAVTITWAYYIRMIRAMFFGESAPEMSRVKDAIRWVDRLPLVMLASASVFFGIFPSQFIRVIEAGVLPILERIEQVAPLLTQAGGILK